jgi:hypothetical protein
MQSYDAVTGVLRRSPGGTPVYDVSVSLFRTCVRHRGHIADGTGLDSDTGNSDCVRHVINLYGFDFRVGVQPA